MDLLLSTPTAPAVSPAPGFVPLLQSASRSIGWAQLMIGNDWYGPGDTVVAQAATRDAIAAVDRALLAKVAPSGHVTPTSALEAARDGKAFLARAAQVMEAEDFAPPVEARAFLSAAQASITAALSEYSAKLEPTPKYR